MTTACDILILGTGPFAQRIACDLAATATEPTRIVLAGRNAFRLAWVLTAARARAQMFARPVTIKSHEIDLSGSERTGELLGSLRASVVVQAASLQPASVISGSGNGWTRRWRIHNSESPQTVSIWWSVRHGRIWTITARRWNDWNDGRPTRC